MGKLKLTGRQVLAGVLALAILTGGFTAAQTLKAKPAEATTTCALRYGSCCPYPAVKYYDGVRLANCYSPGDNRHWAAALYECDQSGLMNAVWATPWHNVRACMEYYLITSDRDYRSIQAHLVDLYITQSYIKPFWDFAFQVASFMTAVARTWVQKVLEYGAPAFCAFVTAGFSPKLAAQASVGCAWAVSAWEDKYNIYQ
jgi:hypothetical protein